MRDAQVLSREIQEGPLFLCGRVPYQLLLHFHRVALLSGQHGRHRESRTILGGRITALRPCKFDATTIYMSARIFAIRSTDVWRVQFILIDFTIRQETILP